MTDLKKVAIVGFASSSRHQAPFNDPTFEIWTMNHAPISWCPKWDVLFEMHALDHIRTQSPHLVEPTEYYQWLQKQTDESKPIYMQRHYDQIPASRELPVAEMNAFVAKHGAGEGFHTENYWTSTISYMLGLAMLQGRPEIHLFGIDLLQEDEYVYQRAGAEYLVGLARGLGIPVYIPTQAALCKAGYVYGFTPDPEGVASQGMSSLKELLDALDKVTSLEQALDLIKKKRNEVAPKNGDVPSLRVLTEYIEDKSKICDEMSKKAHHEAATYHGAMQMVDLVGEWIKSPPVGKTFADLLKEKKADLEQKFQKSREGAITLAGQGEAFRTCVIWGKHYARGGALER